MIFSYPLNTIWKIFLTCNATNFFQDVINKLLSDSVMTTSIVVCSILFTTDQKFWMKEGTILTGSDFIDWRRVQVDKN